MLSKFYYSIIVKNYYRNVCIFFRKPSDQAELKGLSGVIQLLWPSCEENQQHQKRGEKEVLEYQRGEKGVMDLQRGEKRLMGQYRGEEGVMDQHMGKDGVMDQHRGVSGVIDKNMNKVINSDVHGYLSTKSLKVFMPIKKKKEDNVKCELCNTVIKLRPSSMFITQVVGLWMFSFCIFLHFHFFFAELSMI